MSEYTHPHPSPRHVMTAYRRYILEVKRKRNRQLVSHGREPSRRAARGLIHYRPIVDEYLAAKRCVQQRNDQHG